MAFDLVGGTSLWKSPFWIFFFPGRHDTKVEAQMNFVSRPIKCWYHFPKSSRKSGSTFLGWRTSRIWWLLFLCISPDLFEEITFPLSPRCSQGKWIICAQDWPSIIDAGDKTAKKYCINFHVKDDHGLQGQNKAPSTIITSESQTAESFVNLEMVAPTTFRTGVPYSGKVCILASFKVTFKT